MRPNEFALQSMWFRLAMYRSKGETFQMFFFDLMHYCCEGFSTVAPWGAAGDRGNDGWSPKDKHFYQLYAPSATSSWKPPSAAKKALEDFHKLKGAYSLSSYSFVLNDRFEGIPELVHQCMIDIGSSHAPVSAECIGSHALLSKFEKLTGDQKAALMYAVPDVDADFFDFTLLAELMRALTQSDDIFPSLSPNVAAKFDEKLNFNKFSDGVKEALRLYSRQSHRVESVIKVLNDQGLEQDLANELNAKYSETADILDPDARLAALVDDMVPPACKGNKIAFKAYREAALLIVAKYFETCDVFENPLSTPAA